MAIIDIMKELWTKGYTLQEISKTLGFGSNTAFVILEIQKNKAEAFFQRKKGD